MLTTDLSCAFHEYHMFAATVTLALLLVERKKERKKERRYHPTPVPQYLLQTFNTTPLIHDMIAGHQVPSLESRGGGFGLIGKV